jgi:hypothetical protein
MELICVFVLAKNKLWKTRVEFNHGCNHISKYPVWNNANLRLRCRYLESLE